MGNVWELQGNAKQYSYYSTAILKNFPTANFISRTIKFKWFGTLKNSTASKYLGESCSLISLKVMIIYFAAHGFNGSYMEQGAVMPTASQEAIKPNAVNSDYTC